MTGSAVKIRATRPDEAGAYVRLFNQNYSRQKTEAYYHWNYVEPPHPVTLFGAFHEDRLIGCFGIHLLKLTDGTRCALTVDLLIDKPYRGHGLTYRLEQKVEAFARENKAAALTIFPNPTGHAVMARLPGWRSLGPVPTLHLEPAAFQTGSVLQPETESLIKFQKSKAHLQWRYGQHREYDYRINENESSICVTKIFHPENTGDLVDVQGNESAVLIEASCRHLMESGVRNVSAWALPHTAMFQLLTSMGFRTDEKSGRYFWVKILDPDHARLTDTHRWDLAEGDCEVY